ncbi:hypothetical protein GCM10009792_24030 [Microcella alkalica]|uniref:Ribonuclease VapC n=1 Tax=Microcella alkalica TaxID=355930 RepID=A0A839EAF7_9MICO|nr:putative nucleic acid-binding protein [Microcella alkalica]
MIVVDASVLVALVSGSAEEVGRAAAALEEEPHWVVPEHTMIECVSAMRSMTLRGAMRTGRLADDVQQLVDLHLDVWPTEPLLGRVIALMQNVSAFDAAYLALAEELSAPFVTLDRRLASVPGIRCTVRVPGADDLSPSPRR